MDRHWHLSFPNVWNDNGELYMCPESYQLGEVSIYRLNALPDQWAKVRTLISDVEYCDSVFLNYEGKKYMFTYERGEKGEPGKGLLCTIDNAGIREKGVFSMSPEGNRCGGKIIEDDGRLIRVAQNCKGEYGHGLILYEIDAVVPRYTEHEILRVFPKDIAGNFPYNITGVHTYNSLKDLEVIDLKHKNYSFREALARRRVKKVFLNKFR